MRGATFGSDPLVRMTRCGQVLAPLRRTGASPQRLKPELSESRLPANSYHSAGQPSAAKCSTHCCRLSTPISAAASSS